jgi:hypothetical protein
MSTEIDHEDCSEKKVESIRKVQANRQNALKSTGHSQTGTGCPAEGEVVRALLWKHSVTDELKSPLRDGPLLCWLRVRWSALFPCRRH